METLIQTNQTTASLDTINPFVSSSTQFWSNVEFNRFGIIPILLVVISCVGGIAAAFGAQADVLRLSLISFPTIIALALVLGVAPMKVIVYVSVIALILDLLVLFI